ncbi:MAG: DUF1993 domain-containing protein [Lysobacter sp.]
MPRSVSMYSASVPGFIRALGGLAHVLRLGEAHARKEGIAPDALLQLRLIEDMHPLSRQVQIATDLARNGASRLAGRDVVSVADDETTFDQLQARIARTIAHLEAFAPTQFDGSESRTVSIKAGDVDMVFDGDGYLFGFVLPNLYFHVTTAYAILRQAGVPLAKPDFFGRVMPTRD